MRKFAGICVWLLASCTAARAQLAPCLAGFEISPACITERGLDRKAAVYQRKIDEAMSRLRASYKFSLRLVNNPVEAGYDATTVGDVFTDVVRNDEMRPQSFLINVTTDFLANQPEILFEASSLHEVCHVMNDDLTGYHRNGANIEVAEERCVLHAVGEPRYREYLQAYAAYQHWDSAAYESFLARVKDTALVPAPAERDDADTLAERFFRLQADGKARLLVYDGQLHDVTLDSAGDGVRRDPDKLKAVIKTGRPLIFFHNHGTENGSAGMFPTPDDFVAAARLTFMVRRDNPNLPVEFRVIQPGNPSTIVSYGFKGSALEEIQQSDIENALDEQLARESFDGYLRYACPSGFAAGDTCNTLPQYFIWPSDRFFVHYRPD